MGDRSTSSPNLVDKQLRVIICKDQADGDNGVLKKLHIPIFYSPYGYNNSHKLFLAHGQIFLDPQLHEVEKIMIFLYFCSRWGCRESVFGFIYYVWKQYLVILQSF